MKCIFISDTHNKHSQISIPECDILFHSGDWSFKGSQVETEDFAQWLNLQPAKHIVLIPGNHEKIFSEQEPESRKWITDHCPRANLLIHESIEIEGIKIFGSPWTPYFFDWAYNAGRTITEAAHTFKPFIGDLWKDIPKDTQILLTHGPCMGNLDEVIEYGKGRLINVGCKELTKAIFKLKSLRIHAFGHLHLRGGMMEEINKVLYINASVVDDRYIPNDNRKIVLDIDLDCDFQYKKL